MVTNSSIIRVSVKVTPKAKVEKIDPVYKNEKGQLQTKAKVFAPAEDGKANEALVALFSKTYKIPKRNINIVSGWTSRLKIIEFQDVSNSLLFKNYQENLF